MELLWIIGAELSAVATPGCKFDVEALGTTGAFVTAAGTAKLTVND